MLTTATTENFRRSLRYGQVVWHMTEATEVRFCRWVNGGRHAVVMDARTGAELPGLAERCEVQAICE